MNEDKLKIAIINFMWITHYNGYLEEVNDIYEELKTRRIAFKDLINVEKKAIMGLMNLREYFGVGL